MYLFINLSGMILKVNDSSKTLLLCTHGYTMRQQLTSMVSTSSDSKEVRGTGS